VESVTPADTKKEPTVEKPASDGAEASEAAAG
jgi:hypothetical protein